MYGAPYEAREFTIASGTTTSPAIDIAHYTWFALKYPGAITGASLSFQASEDGVNYYTLQNENGAVSLTPPGSEVIVTLEVASHVLAPMRWLKIVSASSEGADRDFILFCKTGILFGTNGGAPA